MAIIEDLKRRVFYVVARTCITLYRWFPVFGSLRAGVAIVQRDGLFLVIQRNDGRGLSLPGGLAGWKESEVQTVRREVEEETGLRVKEQELRMRYHSTADVPCNISVFEVQAEGELKKSWEGPPRWMALSEIEPRLLPSQQPVLPIMRRMGDTESNG